MIFFFFITGLPRVVNGVCAVCNNVKSSMQVWGGTLLGVS